MCMSFEVIDVGYRDPWDPYPDVEPDDRPDPSEYADQPRRRSPFDEQPPVTAVDFLHYVDPDALLDHPF